MHNKTFKHRAKKPINVGLGDLTKEVLDDLLPSGALAYVDSANRRTQVYIRPFRTFSRSWDLYGQRGAGLLVVREAWRAHESVTRMAIPHTSVLAELGALGLAQA